MVPNDWTRLDGVPVPPQLEEACGYPGDARWVRFYWHPCGDEAEYDDGRRSGTGDWSGYLAFVQHTKAASHLAGYDLGSSDGEPKHCLVLDRGERVLYVATMRSAGRFLAAQHPPFAPDPVPGDGEDLAALDTTGLLDLSKWQQVEIDQKQVMDSLRRRRQLLEEMTAFLNDN